MCGQTQALEYSEHQHKSECERARDLRWDAQILTQKLLGEKAKLRRANQRRRRVGYNMSSVEMWKSFVCTGRDGGCRRERLWPNFRGCPRSYTRQTAEHVSEDSRSQVGCSKVWYQPLYLNIRQVPTRVSKCDYFQDSRHIHHVTLSKIYHQQ